MIFTHSTRKNTHTSVWKTLIKLCELWNNFGQPKTQDDKDIIARGKMLL